jgi:hypothetical protein
MMYVTLEDLLSDQLATEAMLTVMLQRPHQNHQAECVASSDDLVTNNIDNAYSITMPIIAKQTVSSTLVDIRQICRPEIRL